MIEQAVIPPPQPAQPMSARPAELRRPKPVAESALAANRIDLQLACGARISFDAAIDDGSLRRLITVIKETA